jgi:tetratricopeptide (TPR) repeat protein
MIALRLVGTVAAALGLAALSLGAEEPPWKRLLRGEDAKRAAALQQQVAELEAAGKFAEAVKPAEALLALRKRVQGEGHWQAADATRQLETLKRVAGLPAEQQRRLVEVPGLMAQAADLGRRAKFAEAEALYRRALAVREEVLGPRHPSTATSYNNLAANFMDQGQPAAAEPLFRKALAIREEALGPQHPDTAQSYNNLAANLGAQGQHAQAEALHRRALAVQGEVLAPPWRSTSTPRASTPRPSRCFARP